jgi:hypothetical protein
MTLNISGGGFGGKKESGQLRFGGRDRPFRKPLPVPGSKSKVRGQEEQVLHEVYSLKYVNERVGRGAS